MSQRSDRREVFQGRLQKLGSNKECWCKVPAFMQRIRCRPMADILCSEKGADAVLLIVAVLTDLEIGYFLKLCKTLGLAALVEVHDKKEMGRVLGIEGIEHVGINNRNLGTFGVDLTSVTRRRFLKESMVDSSATRT